MDLTKSLKNSGKFLLQFLLVVLLILVAFAVGAMFGYTIIGDGGNPLDVFDRVLWEHILGFVFK